MNKFLVLVFLTLGITGTVEAQSLNRKQMEHINAQAISKAYATSVRMWGYDTVKKQQNSAQFSGVVVSAEGHILTVAHAVVPGNTYKVFFPNGQERIAIAMGRMGFKEKQNLPDVAMMKITGTGVWPFAEMGWSASLKVNEPCLSISYPETLNQPKPTVRFGRISIPMTEWGFVQSTCKMEPGDSGGPLFDYMGRVIALHSRIDKSEYVNFEVPVDLYRKYWTALNKAVDYEAMPAEEDTFTADPLASKIMTVPALETISKQFLKLEPKFNGTSVTILSNAGPTEKRAVGTVFSLDGFIAQPELKKVTYIVSKSSIVGQNPMVQMAPGKQLKATVIGRDQKYDLVLLKLEEKIKSGITTRMLRDTTAIKFEALGRFLLSAFPRQQSRVSVVGSEFFSLPKKFSNGYFGANATFINNQIILTAINPKSPASEKLELQDQITGVNGVPISQPPHYGAELMKYSPGDTITIQGVRKGAAYNLPILLTSFPVRGNHPADNIEGGKSIIRDGFERVFSHDAAISADECGGPVFDANGKFYGINIARFSRTSILATPTVVIHNFIREQLLKPGAQNAKIKL